MWSANDCGVSVHQWRLGRTQGPGTLWGFTHGFVEWIQPRGRTGGWWFVFHGDLATGS